MLRRLARTLRAARRERTLPEEAKQARARDRRDGLRDDPGAERAIGLALDWLARAQDCSATADGGVSRHYSLVEGWAASYPETTGYIVPTLLACAADRNNCELGRRARRMVDWLVSIQLEDGSFAGGVANARPVRPVTFNTGQILFGLVSGVTAFGSQYLEPMRRAADWLVRTQDADGCWRRFPTPFASPGEKAYETHVAWALLEAERVDPGRSYGKAALANVRWALAKQHANGWFDHCCLSDPTRPLTHTLGYALRGVVEAYRFSGDDVFLKAARRTADGLRSALREDGHLPGRLDRDWKAAARWVCLTGSAQVSACWLLLDEARGEPSYTDAALAANRYVRRTMRLDASEDLRGAVAGSFPIDGGYGAYKLLNWAAKFTIDANLLELQRAMPASHETR